MKQELWFCHTHAVVVVVVVIIVFGLKLEKKQAVVSAYSPLIRLLHLTFTE